MKIKTILMPYTNHDEAQNVLPIALKITEQYHAILNILQIAPDPKQTMAHLYACVEGPSPSFDGVKEELLAKNKALIEQARSFCQTKTEKSGLPFNPNTLSKDQASVAFTDTLGEPEIIIPNASRLSDLVIMGTGNLSLLQSTLITSSRPLLIIPRNYTGSVGQHIAILWNGSKEVTHALASSMDLLAHAKKITIITKQPKSDNGPSPEELSRYLKIHDIDSKITSIEAQDFSTGMALLEAAQKVKADMVLFGAYTHNRFSQFIFGGATSFLLEHTNIPLLTIH